MYNNVLGIVEMRTEQNPSFYEVICDVSDICDEIIILDPRKILTEEEKRMLTSFDVEIKEINVDEVDYHSYCPEWIYAAYNDERPSQRFKYMKVSLCMNPFINTWLSRLRYLWNEEYQYRVDRGWGNFEIPMLYRFIDEIDYQWTAGLIPDNQPGPKENCMLDLYSYFLLDEESREFVYELYTTSNQTNNFNEVGQYNSLLDREIMVNQAVY